MNVRSRSGRRRAHLLLLTQEALGGQPGMTSDATRCRLPPPASHSGDRWPDGSNGFVLVDHLGRGRRTGPAPPARLGCRRVVEIVARSPRSPPVSCASPPRACDGPRRDPSTAPDGRRGRRACAACPPATTPSVARRRVSMRSSRLGDRRPVDPHRREIGRRVEIVDGARSPRRHPRPAPRASRRRHPQPSSSSRSSSMPAACATSWITVTNTSSANSSRSSHASHSASR